VHTLTGMFSTLATGGGGKVKIRNTDNRIERVEPRQRMIVRFTSRRLRWVLSATFADHRISTGSPGNVSAPPVYRNKRFQIIMFPTGNRFLPAANFVADPGQHGCLVRSVLGPARSN